MFKSYFELVVFEGKKLEECRERAKTQIRTSHNLTPTCQEKSANVVLLNESFVYINLSHDNHCIMRRLTVTICCWRLRYNFSHMYMYEMLRVETNLNKSGLPYVCNLRYLDVSVSMEAVWRKYISSKWL